jgi:hypothetical protein
MRRDRWRGARAAGAALAALGLLGSPAALPGAGRPACELLALEEVGRVAGAPVAIDPSASGPDDRGGDNCVWKARGQVVVEARVERVASPSQATVAFGRAATEAFGARPAPAKVPGLGDEALHRDFERVRGGALVIRRGAVVVGMSGMLPRDALVGLARLLLPRL